MIADVAPYRTAVHDQRFSPALLLAAAATCAYAVFIARTAFFVDNAWHFTLLDDAMVSMRYARNLADGHGLVWNAGEPAVEGYTNLLWTLWMAVVHALGVPAAKTSLVIAASSIPLLMALAWMAAAIATRLTGAPTRRTKALVVALVCFCYPLIYWALRGTEIGAIAVAVAACTLFALRLIERIRPADVAGFATAAMAATLLRLDSIVAVVILGGAVVAFRPAHERLKLAFGLALVAGVPIVAHGVFSVLYYSSFLPNTYYLKMTGVDVSTRVSRGSLMFALIALRHLFPLLVLALPACRSGAHAARERRILLTVFAGQALYSVYAGGDAWESYGFANRYLTVAVPLLLVLAALEIEMLAGKVSIDRLVRVVRTLALFAAAKIVIEWMLVAANRNVDFDLLFLYRNHTALAISAIGSALALTAVVFLKAESLIGFMTHVWSGGPVRLKRNATGVTAALAVAVWALMNGQNVALWLRFNAPEVIYDKRTARAGLLIASSTRDDAVVAAARVGALSYFAKRRSLDLLGKSDPAIARMKPVSVFKPGHDRWDYPESVDRGHPDVIGDLWLPTERDFRYLDAAGYRKLPNGLYVRHQSPRVDLARIGDDVGL